MLPRVRREINELIDSHVMSRTRFDAKSTEVVRASSTTVVLERVETLYPRFIDEAGKDATRAPAPEKRVVKWELREERGRWLLHEGTVIRREALSGRRP
jgi:hypothetical protein